MLQELSIQNFAIIDDLSIHFSDGLTILSGETGAGKSIIINAFNLLLGSRANAKLIRTGAQMAELEAFFEISEESRTAQIMVASGYDPTDGLLIQRRILSNERHRIYINGRLATMQILTELTENLASISGQHAHQGLLKENQHLLILDQLGDLMPLRHSLYKAYHSVLALIQTLDSLLKNRQDQNNQRELLLFQIKEIEEAGIQPDEDENLEKERLRLRHAETLYQAAHDSKTILYDCDNATVEQLDQASKMLEKAAIIDADLENSALRLKEAVFQIQDIVENLRNYCERVEFNPARLEAVEARLTVLGQLKRKYGGTLAAVVQKFKEIDHQLKTIEDVDSQIKSIQSQLKAAYKKLTDLAEELSEKRHKTAKKLSDNVERELHTLKMSQSRFEVQLRCIKAQSDSNPYLHLNGNVLTETGLDRAAFMIAPNPGEAIKPLAAIASGGELSRVILAIKATMAKSDSLETVVFDEVDAGIGGAVADVVGEKLKELARHHQIVCITHLPQIAKFGDHHFKIEKIVEAGRTKTEIKPLDSKERVIEIARMLGGVKITQTTLDHARELLES